nr:hypothetical protein Itr_chr05CG03220 [Ipomoea trifida]GMC94966.1 hypothetical protein Iba_chr05cCG3990 [Ipomoea batatas]
MIIALLFTEDEGALPEFGDSDEGRDGADEGGDRFAAGAGGPPAGTAGGGRNTVGGLLFPVASGEVFVGSDCNDGEGVDGIGKASGVLVGAGDCGGAGEGRGGDGGGADSERGGASDEDGVGGGAEGVGGGEDGGDGGG